MKTMGPGRFRVFLSDGALIKPRVEQQDCTGADQVPRSSETIAPGWTQDGIRVKRPNQTYDLAQVLAALASGRAATVAAALGSALAPRGEILAALLASPDDRVVARVFDLAWQHIGPRMPDDRMHLLRWYLSTEYTTALPRRKATHLALMTRVITAEALPKTETGCDLGCVAARFAFEIDGPLTLRGAAIRLLHRLEAQWSDHPPRDTMLFAAIHAVDLGLLRRLVDRWPDTPQSAQMQRGFDWSVALLAEFGGIDPWMEGVIEGRYRMDPKSPVAAQRMTQLGQHRGQSFASLAPVLRGIRRRKDDSNLQPALQYGYWHARNENLEGEIEYFAKALKRLDPKWSGTEGTGLAARAGGTGSPPMAGTLADLSAGALALIATEPRLGGPVCPSELAVQFDALAMAMDRAAWPETWQVQDALNVAQRLIQIDKAEFAWIVHFTDTPHAQGQPAYGTVDLQFYPVLHRGVLQVTAALCQAGLERFLIGKAAISHGPVARLLQLCTHACLELDQVDRARTWLDRFDALGLFGDLVAILRDNRHMQVGDVARAAATTPASRDGSLVLPFHPRARWSKAERISWTKVARDARIKGVFDLIWPDGTRQKVDHSAPQGMIATARVPGLRLVSEDMLIGPGGHVLRPNTYHTSAEYPWTSAVVVASQKRALRLRPTSTAECDTPVLVLEAFEALRWKNYYHWMIPILSRIALARTLGLLDNRRLVVPEGLSRWMAETLTLLGLGTDRLIIVPVGQDIRFADAVLMSSIEHVSAAGVQALRHLLLPKPKAQPVGKGRALFLSRRTQHLRKLQNEIDIEDLAQEMGFTLISPQDHTVAEQVQLFSEARAIASVEGAALTNTLFCPPGTRVLAMLCENDMMPIYNDLSLVLGHHHRKLAGRGVVEGGTSNRFQPAFRIDPALVRQSLEWVLNGVAQDAQEEAP